MRGLLLNQRGRDQLKALSKTLVVDNIGKISYLICYLLHKFGWSIFYLESSLDEEYTKLFTPLSFENVKQAAEKWYKLRDNWLVNTKPWLSKNYYFKEISCRWVDSEESENKLMAAISGYFLSCIDEKTFLHLFASELASSQKKVIVLDTKGKWYISFIAKSMQKNYQTILFPRNILRRLSLKKSSKFMKKLYQRILSNFSSFPNKSSPRLVEQESHYESRVLFFPHKGIYYGDLFLKDHYFDEQITDLKPENMVFLGYGDEADQSRESFEWFEKRSIPFDDLHRKFPKKINIIKKIHFKSFLKGISQGLNSCALTLIVTKFHLQVERYLAALEKYKESKLALLGFDILVPKPLLYALFLKKIKVLATQERLLPAFLKGYPLLLDTYVSISQAAILEMKKYPDYYAIGSYVNAGPIRVAKYPDDCIDDYYKSLAGDRKIILVLPFHSPRDEYANRMTLVNNWKNNMKFYEDIISLARKYRGLFFVIKEKEVTLPHVLKMRKIFKTILQTENIHYEDQLAKYTPFKMASICSGAIAMHTSFGDELLFLKKPVIFYDFGLSAPLPFFSYSELNIVAESKENLFRKTREYFIQNNPVHNLSSLYPSEDRFYPVKILKYELQQQLES